MRMDDIACLFGSHGHPNQARKRYCFGANIKKPDLTLRNVTGLLRSLLTLGGFSPVRCESL